MNPDLPLEQPSVSIPVAISGRSPRHGRFLAAALFLLVAGPLRALGPHELAVLVNAGCPDSLEIANTFIRTRGIPLENVVRLDLPDSVFHPRAEISPEEFARHVWEPATRALEARGNAPHILAWAYSAGFPVRVTTRPAGVSLHGMTFARNAPVIHTATNQQGQAIHVFPVSPLFRGPMQPGAPAGPPLSLEQFREGLGESMPLPAMSLAHTGARGLDVPESLRVLEMGALADGMRPEGRVAFIRTGDTARSAPREWQFEAAARELRGLGVEVEIAADYPDRTRPLLGLLTGAASPPAHRIGPFAPGSIAEHLTSWAGAFHEPQQAKLTDWLLAGASSSAGTVVEPLNLWQKFPHARIFAFAAQGCAALESWYQALAMPQQQFLVGDPLSRPFAPRMMLTLISPDGEEEDGEEAEPGRAFLALVSPQNLTEYLDYVFLLNGRMITPPLPRPIIRFDPSRLPPGFHELRVVAYARYPVRHQAFAVLDFETADPGRAVAFRDPPQGPLDGLRPWTIRVEARGEPHRVGVLAQGREVAAAAGAAAELTVEPGSIGAGPVTLRPTAHYGTPEAPVVVRGRPLRATLVRRNEAPRIHEIRRSPAPGRDGIRLRPVASDPDDDPLVIRWFERPAPDAISARADHAVVAVEADALRISPPEDRPFGVAPFPGGPASEYAVEARVDAGAPPRLPAVTAGLVFGFESENRFGFFGLHGRSGAWAIGFADGDRLIFRVERGAPIRPNRWVRLSVRLTDDGRIEGLADDRVVCVLDGSGDRWAAGPGGLLAGGGPARFRAAARAWPSADPEIRLPASDAPAVSVRVSDPWTSTWEHLP